MTAPTDDDLAVTPAHIELSPVIFDAFLLHLEDHIRREVVAEYDQIEAARWAPIRSHLRDIASRPIVSRRPVQEIAQ